MRPEVLTWLRQSRADLCVARAMLNGDHFFAAAFYCHQAVEKALKGTFIHLNRAMPPKTHDLVYLGRALSIPEEVMSDLRLLNPEYTISRYPDAANGLPADNYDRRKADMLMASAQRAFEWVDSALTDKD